jgi:hypothetical protein
MPDTLPIDQIVNEIKSQFDVNGDFVRSLVQSLSKNVLDKLLSTKSNNPIEQKNPEKKEADTVKETARPLPPTPLINRSIEESITKNLPLLNDNLQELIRVTNEGIAKKESIKLPDFSKSFTFENFFKNFPANFVTGDKSPETVDYYSKRIAKAQAADQKKDSTKDLNSIKEYIRGTTDIQGKGGRLDQFIGKLFGGKIEKLLARKPDEEKDPLSPVQVPAPKSLLEKEKPADVLAKFDGFTPDGLRQFKDALPDILKGKFGNGGEENQKKGGAYPPGGYNGGRGGILDMLGAAAFGAGAKPALGMAGRALGWVKGLFRGGAPVEPPMTGEVVQPKLPATIEDVRFENAKPANAKVVEPIVKGASKVIPGASEGLVEGGAEGAAEGFGRAIPFIGPAIAAAFTAYDINKINKQEKEGKLTKQEATKEKGGAVGQGVGAIGGGIAGAELGAAVGTLIFPGVGTVVGGLLGGAIGGVGGAMAGKAIGKDIAKDPNEGHEGYHMEGAGRNGHWVKDTPTINVKTKDFKADNPVSITPEQTTPKIDTSTGDVTDESSKHLENISDKTDLTNDSLKDIAAGINNLNSLMKAFGTSVLENPKANNTTIVNNQTSGTSKVANSSDFAKAGDSRISDFRRFVDQSRQNYNYAS